MSSLFLESVGYLLNINPTVKQSSRDSYDLSILLLITNNIPDIGKTDKNSGTVAVPETFLYIEFLK